MERNGKERVLEEAYRKCVLAYNSENISYVTFDFHDKWYVSKYIQIPILHSTDLSFYKAFLCFFCVAED